MNRVAPTYQAYEGKLMQMTPYGCYTHQHLLNSECSNTAWFDYFHNFVESGASSTIATQHFAFFVVVVRNVSIFVFFCSFCDAITFD